MNRKVLFLGCNHNQVPYLLAAKDLGFYVVGTDQDPDAPGAKHADKFHSVGYLDVEGLIRVAREEEMNSADGIFTAAAHFANEGAATVADLLGIPYFSPKAVDICLDKTKLYPFLKRIGVPVPNYRILRGAAAKVPDSERAYYLKSDYGKSPQYCYRVTKGAIPELPREKDRFFRRNFLIQEEVKGVHFRINLSPVGVSVFLKFDDTSSVPLQVLGAGHGEVVRGLREVVSKLGMDSFLVKFDLIVNETGWFVIDVGLDPPMRLRLLFECLGLDFFKPYVRLYLLGEDAGFPPWAELCQHILIQGRPEEGFSFKKLGGDI